MYELITMWKNTRMVVLTALTAAVYAAILIPFKVIIPIIPGFTEFRPANAIPIVCSLLFGPAAAYGAAIGNLIGDCVGGTLGPGSIFGFFGNFLYGYVPYKVWGRLGPLSSKKDPEMKSRRVIGEYIMVVMLASLFCAVVIGWGVDVLGLIPFAALGNIIFINNFIVSVLIGPFLLAILYPRVKGWGLTYPKIMGREKTSTPKFGWLGVLLAWIGGVSGLVIGNLISIGVYNSTWFAFVGVKGEVGLFLGLLPSIILIILSTIFL